MVKQYTVNQLAKLSGVSVRTLHHYDEIGLLTPSIRTEARYRLYGENELLRLQQIFFYREMDIPLKEIAEILDDPEFNLVQALEQHKQVLQQRKEQVETLLITIDKTIQHLKNKKIMVTPEELYEGLPKETAEAYRKEAVEKYGKESVEQSEKALLNFTKEEFRALGQEQKEISDGIFALMKTESPQSKKVQELIARHYVVTRKFWGTHGSANPQAQQYAGLGQLYVNDERFTMVNDQPQPEYARFMCAAMEHYAATALNQ